MLLKIIEANVRHHLSQPRLNGPSFRHMKRQDQDHSQTIEQIQIVEEVGTSESLYIDENK